MNHPKASIEFSIVRAYARHVSLVRGNIWSLEQWLQIVLAGLLSALESEINLTDVNIHLLKAVSHE